MTNITKGDRVQINHMSGTEYGVVFRVSGLGREVSQIHVQMDDGSTCWFPAYQVKVA